MNLNLHMFYLQTIKTILPVAFDINVTIIKLALIKLYICKKLTVLDLESMNPLYTENIRLFYLIDIVLELYINNNLQ